jgi:predicted ATP-dependent serine protease
MSIVDTSWTCGCGALNAPWLKECGRCGASSSSNEVDTREFYNSYMEKKRQYRSNQGRRDSQYESTAKVLGFGALMLFGALLIASVWELIDLIW